MDLGGAEVREGGGCDQNKLYEILKELKCQLQHTVIYLMKNHQINTKINICKTKCLSQCLTCGKDRHYLSCEI